MPSLLLPLHTSSHLYRTAESSLDIRATYIFHVGRPSSTYDLSVPRCYGDVPCSHLFGRATQVSARGARRPYCGAVACASRRAQQTRTHTYTHTLTHSRRRPYRVRPFHNNPYTDRSCSYSHFSLILTVRVYKSLKTKRLWAAAAAAPSAAAPATQSSRTALAAAAGGGGAAAETGASVWPYLPFPPS